MARGKRFCLHPSERAFELRLLCDLPFPSQHRCPLKVGQRPDCQNLPPSGASRLSRLCRSSHLQLRLSCPGRRLNCCSRCDFYCHRLVRSLHFAFQSRRSESFVPPLARSDRRSLQSLS